MLVSPNSNTNSDSSFDISKRIILRLKQGKMDNQLLEILHQVFEKELEQENMVLSRPERTRLFHQAAKAVLTDVLAKIDGDQ